MRGAALASSSVLLWPNHLSIPFVLSRVSETESRKAFTRNSVIESKPDLQIPFVLSLSKDGRAHWPRLETPFDAAGQAGSGRTAISYSF